MGAKDKAFESERIKYRQRIRLLELENTKIKGEKNLLIMDLQKAEEDIRNKEDHINRLLEYMDLSPEEVKSKIKINKVASNIFQMMGRSGGIWGL